MANSGENGEKFDDVVSQPRIQFALIDDFNSIFASFLLSTKAATMKLSTAKIYRRDITSKSFHASKHF